MNKMMMTVGLALALGVTVQTQQEQAQQILKEAGVPLDRGSLPPARGI